MAAQPCIPPPVSAWRTAHTAAQLVVRLVVLAILLASAAAVTKLMAMNVTAARNLVWDGAAASSRIAIAMQARGSWDLCVGACVHSRRHVVSSVCVNKVVCMWLLVQAHPLSTAQLQAAPALANEALEHVADAVGSDAAAALAAGTAAYDQLAYCSVQLNQTCSEGLSQ
jgi:hypothetical protein